jgi:hypothetical protein
MSKIRTLCVTRCGNERIAQALRACELHAGGWSWSAAVKLSRGSRPAGVSLPRAWALASPATDSRPEQSQKISDSGEKGG